MWGEFRYRGFRWGSWGEGEMETEKKECGLGRGWEGIIPGMEGPGAVPGTGWDEPPVMRCPGLTSYKILGTARGQR